MLAVSSIAWPDDADFAGMALLQSLGVQGVELVPGRILDRGCSGPDSRHEEYNSVLKKYGLTPVAMQAIYYGADNTFTCLSRIPCSPVCSITQFELLLWPMT